MIMRSMIFKEVVFKLGSLNLDTREFIRGRIDLIKKDRLMTVRMDVNNLPPKPKRDF